MANMWTFRDGATGSLVHHDIGSATLMGFLAANPSLGPVRRGAVEDPNYIAPTASGGNLEAPVVEQSDPTSAEPAFKATDSDSKRNTNSQLEQKQHLLPSEYRGMSIEQIVQKAQQVIDQGLFQERSYATPFDLTVLNNLVAILTGAGEGAAADSLVEYYDTTEAPAAGFANPDAFSPENRYGFDYEVDPETGVTTQVDRSGLFADNSEVSGDIRTVLEAVSPAITPNQQAALQEFLDAMGGPLFDENGQPIFPELPMEVFSELLSNVDIAPIIGPILQDLIGSRSDVIQNVTSNATSLQMANAQFNPFSRTAESDQALQAMLAGKQIEQTQAQFNPFGLSNTQGVQAIQDQFNPYAQDADARLALAKQQFDPYGQDAAARTNLIKAQFNPYNLSQDQGLQAITGQYNPYGFSAPQGLEGISRQFNPYGETAADRLALAGMAQNPFGRNQFEDQMLQQSLARGGLSADQRLAEIRASNNPMNTQNFLSFLGNPSAVGSAVSLGNQGFLNQLGGGQGLPQQSQQTLNPLAPLVEQLMNDRLASDPASPVDTGSADFSYGAMKPYDPTAPASTQADFQDKTAEEIGFYEGSAAAQGVTPSALGQKTARVTPGGVSMGRGRI